MNRIGQILQLRKKDILATASRYQATNVRLFGSVVRGEENDKSDIDLLVDFLPGATLFDQIGLVQELSQKLNRKVDVVSARALNSHLRQQVLKEARPL
jgi:predicted nucleotidyltransferase